MPSDHFIQKVFKTAIKCKNVTFGSKPTDIFQQLFKRYVASCAALLHDVNDG